MIVSHLTNNETFLGMWLNGYRYYYNSCSNCPPSFSDTHAWRHLCQWSRALTMMLWSYAMSNVPQRALLQFVNVTCHTWEINRTYCWMVVHILLSTRLGSGLFDDVCTKINTDYLFAFSFRFNQLW